MGNVIEVQKLTKEYKNIKAVDALSFEVREGEILGLLGPNGSGKSTTINCILSLLNFSKGSIKLFGSEMKPDAYELKSKVGVVFQDVAVFDELTVYENIDYFCGLYIKNKGIRKQYIQDALTLVGLEEFTKFRPKQLSGGLLRRLNIACGIAHKPKLIFLDEPTVAVDPQSRNNILDGIKQLRDKGAILASGTNDELKELAKIEEKITVEISNLDARYIEAIKQFETVDMVTYSDNLLLITYQKGKNNLVALMDFLKQEGIEYSKIYSERPTLNDVFLELTGKELRD